MITNGTSNWAPIRLHIAKAELTRTYHGDIMCPVRVSARVAVRTLVVRNTGCLVMLSVMANISQALSAAGCDSPCDQSISCSSAHVILVLCSSRRSWLHRAPLMSDAESGIPVAFVDLNSATETDTTTDAACPQCANKRPPQRPHRCWSRRSRARDANC